MRRLSWLRRRTPPVEVIALYEQPLHLADLNHPDPERAWLASAREHQARTHAVRLRAEVTW